MLSKFTLINILTGKLLTFCYFFILTTRSSEVKVKSKPVSIKVSIVKKSDFILKFSNKYLLICSLSIFTILGVSQQAKGYDLEACAKDPIEKSEIINLLQPFDQQMINCIPKLDSMATQWQSKSKDILSAIDRVRMGNDGENDIEKLEYNLNSNTINFVLKVRAKHTWKVNIPAVRTDVPVTKFRWVNVPYPDVRWDRKCKFGICVKVPDYFTNHRREKVPYVEIETRTITPEKTIQESASATCKYEYTFNLSTLEQKPVFNCSQGHLGNVKLDASPITQILNGEMPTLGSLINSVSLTPPLFKDANRDEYENVKNKMISDHPNSIVYFSSQSFVNWASTKNQTVNGIAAFFSAGSYSAELIRQIEERLRTELTFMATFASQTGTELATEQIVSMMTGKESLDLQGYRISVKVVNTPEIFQKCVVTGDCIPAIELPRLGFAIIATKI
jgi:hypothetical protein